MAGAEFKITDAIDDSIFRKLKAIGDEAEKTTKKYADLVKGLAEQTHINPSGLDELQRKASKGNEALERLAETEKELARLQKEQKKVYADISKELEKQVKQATAKAKQDAAEIARERQKIKLENEKQKQAKKTAVTEKEISSALSTQAKTLAEASRQNSILRQAVQKVDITMDDAIETIERYNAKIEENEALQDKFTDAMTRRRRNVGNYASAFDGLGMSVQQVARELPSLSLGINTFVLAISNNLPILIDELNRAREANAKLRKEGQQTVPVWKQLGKSILSWQTLLIVGITLLSSYGKEVKDWAVSLFKGKEAAQSYEESLKKINNALHENMGDYADTITKLKSLQDAWNSLGSDLEAKKELIDENRGFFEDLGISVDDVNDAETLFVEQTPTMINALMLKAKATSAYNLSVEEETKAMKKRMEAEKAMASTNIWDYWNAGIDVLGNFDAVLQGIDMWNPQKYAQARAGGLLLESDAANEAANAYRKLYTELQTQAKELLSSSGFSLKTKTEEDTEAAKKAYQDYMDDIRKQSRQLDVDLIDDEHERNIAAIKKEYKDRKDAIVGYSEEEIKLREKLDKMEAKELEKENTRYEAFLQSKAEAEIKGVNEAAKLQVEALKNGLKEQENELLKGHKGTKADEQKHKREMLRLTYEYNRQILLAQIEAAEKELEIAEASGKIPEAKLEEMREKVRGLKAEISNLDVNFDLSIKKDDAQSEEDRIKELARALDKVTEATRGVIGGFSDMFSVVNDITIDIAKGFDEMWSELDNDERIAYILGKFSKLASGITQVMSDMYATRIEEIEEEQDKLDEAEEKELARIDRLAETGAISEEEAEARKRAAEDKTAKKNEELEKKKADMKMKQAKWDKANNIAQASIATALAVIKALPNFILAGVVAAFGAAQIAMMLAQPLPKYAKGTDFHKGGLAIVGDGGVPETILTNNGAYITPSIPTLVDMPRGAKVIPYALDEKQILGQGTERLISLINERKEEKMPIIHMETDNRGVEKRLENLEYTQKKTFKELIKAINRQEYKSFASRI